MFFFGFRVNEVKQFTCKDIKSSLLKEEIEADIIKQGILRDISISLKAKEELSTLLYSTKGEYFVKYKGDSLRVCLNRFIKNILGDGYTSHGFRRNAVTTIANSLNTKVAQNWIGHKDIKTTLRYVHSSKESLQKASDSIGS